MPFFFAQARVPTVALLFHGLRTAAQKPKKGNGGKMALGVGVGLFGGLLIGDMISDVGNMAAYDVGFDDGFGF